MLFPCASLRKLPSALRNNYTRQRGWTRRGKRNRAHPTDPRSRFTSRHLETRRETRDPSRSARARARSTRRLLMSASQSGNFSTSRRVMHEPRGGGGEGTEQAILPDRSKCTQVWQLPRCSLSAARSDPESLFFFFSPSERETAARLKILRAATSFADQGREMGGREGQNKGGGGGGWGERETRRKKLRGVV